MLLSFVIVVIVVMIIRLCRCCCCCCCDLYRNQYFSGNDEGGSPEKNCAEKDEPTPSFDYSILGERIDNMSYLSYIYIYICLHQRELETLCQVDSPSLLLMICVDDIKIQN